MAGTPDAVAAPIDGSVDGKTPMRCLTITLNAAVDTTYALDRLKRGAINLVAQRTAVPGGKGNNVARVLATLGHSVVATGFVGGRSGQFIEDGLRDLEIETAFARVEGESRICLTVVERGSGTITEIREPGVDVPPEAMERLARLVAEAGRGADAVVASGSLPPGLAADAYARLLGPLGPSPAFVALDASGEALRLGLAGRPNLISPNAAEMTALMGRPGDTGEMIAFARRELIGRALADDALVLLSLGGRGAALVSRDGTFFASAPAVVAVNTVGCGDALLAGFLDARSRTDDAAAALAHAVAVGTAAALQETIGVLRLDDVARLRGEVEVTRVAA